MHHLSSLSRRKGNITCRSGRCQEQVRFFALLRIKPHAPPLVRVPVNSFEFHSCERTPRWTTYCVCCGTEQLCCPTPSSHRLRRGLPGYLILFAPHAFEPQRQLPSSKPPSPLVFLLISTHFTATLEFRLPLRYSRLTVSMQSGLSPGFHIWLATPSTLPLHPVNPDNACTIRITAAAGTYLAGAS